MFDEAIAMNNYTLKHPSTIGRDYMVEKFNQAFNLNITYGFFKNKLDEFKKSYKRWKVLMHKTGITVDPDTSMIYASDTWWKDQEFVSSNNNFTHQYIIQNISLKEFNGF